MTEWLKGCEICNSGLCKAMDQLISKHNLPERTAAQQLALTVKERLGYGLYTGKQLRDRYRYHTGKKKKPKLYSSKDFTQEELNSLARGTGVAEIPPVKEVKAIQAAKELKSQSQVSHIAKQIAEGNVSDDDAKTVGDALAKAIASGKAAPRVGSRVATAVRKSHKKGVIKPRKDPDNFQRLWKHVKAASEGLTYWADKTITPTTEDEADAAKGILMAAQSVIVQFARLGIDVVGTYETFVAPQPAKEGKTLKLV